MALTTRNCSAAIHCYWSTSCSWSWTFFDQTPLQYYRNRFTSRIWNCHSLGLISPYLLFSLHLSVIQLCLLSNKSLFYKQNYPEDSQKKKKKEPEAQFCDSSTRVRSGSLCTTTHTRYFHQEKTWNVKCRSCLFISA